MSNLLKKASIITTPTAYDDGRILSVKPNENIYGSEEIVNGDFATNSDWIVGSTWTISGGSANCDGGTSNLDQASIVTNTKYKVTITVSNITTGTLAVRLGGSNVDVLSLTKNGTYTGYGLSNGDVFRLRSQSGFDGSVDNVSVVEDLSGDFDFERGSAATRVNAQGLVENVQILSSELVQNGNFSEIGSEEVSNGDFSQEGAEQVVNGDFATDSDWIGTRTIANGQLTKGSGGGLVYQSTLDGTIKSYKVIVDVAEKNGVSLRLYLGGNQFALDEGLQTLYVQSGNSNTFIGFNNGADSVINSISCVEVGQDWDFINNVTVGNGVATFLDSGSNLNSRIIQNNILTSGKVYKLTFEVTRYVAGSVQVLIGGGTISEANILSGVGTYTIYGISDGTNLSIKRNGGYPNYDFDITNISVKEVGQDWEVADYGAVNPSAVITPSTEGVKLEKTVSADWRSSFLVQPISYTIGSKYKVTFKLKNGNLPSGGDVFVRSEYSSSSQTIASNIVLTNDWVEYTYHYEADSNSTDISFGEVNWQNAGVGEYFYIDNVSVVEVTDNTDLPRINYEGFSYQDVLGSELITNGDFAVDSNWIKDTGWTISGGLLNCNNSLSNNTRQLISSYSTDKKYIITYTVSNYVSGGVKVNLGYTTGTVRSANGTYTEERTFSDGGAFNGYLRIFSDGASEVSIDNVSLKEITGQEVVPNSGCGSWLFEPQSTNLYPYSQTVTSGGLTFFTGGSATATLTNNYSISPDGTQNALRFQATVLNDISSRAAVRSLLSTSAVMSTVSVYAKSNTNENYTMVFHYEGGVRDTFVVTPKWQRFSFSEVSDATNNVGVELRGTYTSLEADVSLWGFQFENQSYATSVIPTNGAASTRLQDIANNSGNSTLINSTEGVLYAEIAALTDLGSYRLISLNSDNSPSNRITIAYDAVNNQIYGQCVAGGVSQALFTTQPTSISDFNKIALKYKANDLAFWVNGLEVGTNTSASIPTNLNRLSFDRADAAAFFYGKNKALAVWKEALTDTELELLTAPAPEFPTFSLDFDTIAEQFTFTRGSEATFVNAQGLIESTASNDAPRIDYSTGAKAFLLEPQSTNLITYSEDFSQWTTVRSTATSGFNSPNGTLNAFKFTEDTDNNTHLFYNDGFTIADATEYTMSLFVKYNGRQWFRLYGQFGASNKNAYFDIQNGLLGFKDSGVTSKIKDYGNGWYRISQTVTSDGTFGRFRGYLAEADNDAFYQGDGTSGVYIWGGQYEQKSYPTSYIPTDGATATRNQETCKDATPTINSEEGVLYAEISALANDGTFREISLNDGTTSNVVEIRYTNINNAFEFVVRNANTVQVASSFTFTDATQFNKIAFSYKTDDYKMYVNGVEVASDTIGTMPSGLNKLSFNWGGFNPFFGNTKGLQLFDKALSDYQLKQLTTI